MNIIITNDFLKKKTPIIGHITIVKQLSQVCEKQRTTQQQV